MTELALSTDTAPQPPAVILQLLEKLGLSYQVRSDLPNLPAAQRLQAVQAHRDKPRQAARGGRARTGACPRAGRPGGGNTLQKRMNQYSKRN